MKLIHPDVVKIDPEVYRRLSYAKRTPIEIIHELSQQSSTNEKIEILKSALLESESFLVGVKLALDPLVKFWIRKIPTYVPAKATAYACSTLLVQLSNMLRNREVTGTAAVNKLREYLEIASAEDAEFISKVIAKDLECGVNIGLVNTAWKAAAGTREALIKEFPVMLCSSFDLDAVKNFKYPALVQTKMDGMRIAAVMHPGGAIVFHTRNGNTLEDTPSGVEVNISTGFKDYSSSGVVIDGEMVVVENGVLAPRKRSNGIMTRLIRGTATEEERASVHFFIWDLIPYKVFTGDEQLAKQFPYDARYKLLEKVVNEDSGLSNIHLVKSTIVSNYLDAIRLFEEELKSGNEGVIVKSLNNIWAFQRSKTQIKIKAELEMDAKIVDVVEGTGKYEGMLGSFVCEAADELGPIVFNVGSGLTDEDRRQFWEDKPIGKTINVKYNEIISSSGYSPRSLFLPIFVEVRSDVGPF